MNRLTSNFELAWVREEAAKLDVLLTNGDAWVSGWSSLLASAAPTLSEELRALWTKDVGALHRKFAKLAPAVASEANSTEHGGKGQPPLDGIAELPAAAQSPPTWTLPKLYKFADLGAAFPEVPDATEERPLPELSVPVGALSTALIKTICLCVQSCMYDRCYSAGLEKLGCIATTIADKSCKLMYNPKGHDGNLCLHFAGAVSLTRSSQSLCVLTLRVVGEKAGERDAPRFGVYVAGDKMQSLSGCNNDGCFIPAWMLRVVKHAEDATMDIAYQRVDVQMPFVIRALLGLPEDAGDAEQPSAAPTLSYLQPVAILKEQDHGATGVELTRLAYEDECRPPKRKGSAVPSDISELLGAAVLRRATDAPGVVQKGGAKGSGTAAIVARGAVHLLK